jgi:hypothetical protein
MAVLAWSRNWSSLKTSLFGDEFLFSADTSLDDDSNWLVDSLYVLLCGSIGKNRSGHQG